MTKETNLEDISFDTIYDTVKEISTATITTKSSLGYFSSDIFLYGELGQSQVSMRNDSGMVEMLITDPDGKFIYLGKLSLMLPMGFIAGEFYGVFKAVSAYVKGGFDEVKLEERS